jgi:electron transport complex protein RnfA
MKFYIALLIMGILTSNFVLSKFLGICPFLGVSKKLNTAVGMSAAVIFVMLLATAATYPLFGLLKKLDLEYLKTIVFILVIAALVQIVEIVMKKYIKPLYNALGIYLPLITTNCAVLGVVILNIDNISAYSAYGFGFGHAMVSSFAAGAGFLLAMVLFAGVRSRLETADVPKSLEGLPITLIAAAIVSMSFLGFTGIVEGMGLL